MYIVMQSSQNILSSLSLYSNLTTKTSITKQKEETLLMQKSKWPYGILKGLKWNALL